jgi:uridine kinase
MQGESHAHSALLEWLQAQRSTVLVGIDGGGGSEKSTFARALERVDPSLVTVVEMDDFFRPSHDRPRGEGRDKPIGGDFDWQRLRDQVLVPIAEEKNSSYQRR